MKSKKLTQPLWPALLLLIISLLVAISWLLLVQDNKNPTKQETSSVSFIALQNLPREAIHTLALIKRGGPFPYDKDGSIFNNFEGKLPKKKRGYYREYTVSTPKLKTRGARRIIAGSGKNNDVKTSGEYYYTPDHYETFQQIKE